MRKAWLNLGILLSLVIAMGTAHAAPYAPSAIRAPDESYEDLYFDNLAKLLVSPFAAQELQEPPAQLVQSVYASKKAYDKLNFANIPEVESYEVLMKEFEYIRDTRFMTNQNLAFHRRLSWMYPEDGCYVRADLASYFAQAKSYVKPKKLFAFGNLKVETKNSVSGFVGWWYHVVLTYRVGDQPYVLDPAIEPTRPLTIVEWGERMGATQDRKIDFAICSAGSYHPYSDCRNAVAKDFPEIESTQLTFLEFEYDRIKELNRNPEEELGENPPWKKLVQQPQPPKKDGEMKERVLPQPKANP